jgi:hypothetical protein
MVVGLLKFEKQHHMISIAEPDKILAPNTVP